MHEQHIQIAAVLTHLFIHIFRICCENFRPRSSPDRVKWPHLMKSFNARYRYADGTIALKLPAIGTSNAAYKMYISEFCYRWPKVRSILWHLPYKLIGENWKAFVLDGNHSKHSQTSGYKQLTPWIGKLRPVTPPHNPKVTSGQERLPKFFGNSFYRQARAMKTSYMCSGRRYGSTEKHITFSNQVMTLT